MSNYWTEKIVSWCLLLLCSEKIPITLIWIFLDTGVLKLYLLQLTQMTLQYVEFPGLVMAVHVFIQISVLYITAEQVSWLFCHQWAGLQHNCPSWSPSTFSICGPLLLKYFHFICGQFSEVSHIMRTYVIPLKTSRKVLHLPLLCFCSN